MASPVIGGVLGAANVIGGIATNNAQSKAQNAQAKQQAQALQSSLLLERQRVIDQSALEEMQVKLARQFAAQQSAMGQLQMQSDAQAFDAAQQLQALQTQQQLAGSRVQNEAELANQNIGVTNMQSQAAQQRYGAEMAGLQGVSEAAQTERTQAMQNIEQLQQVRGAMRQHDLAADAQYSLDPNSEAGRAARAASTRDVMVGALDASRRASVSQDEAALQAEYIKGISQTLRSMGISEAAATEAAAVVTQQIAKAGYDLNNINLDSLFNQAQNEQAIQRTAFQANQQQQQMATKMEQLAQTVAFNTAEQTSLQNRNASLKAIEEQAKYGTQFGASSPGFLGNALQIASGAYGVYQQFAKPAPVAMPSVLSPTPYHYPQNTFMRPAQHEVVR